MRSMTEALAVEIQRAIDALRASHQIELEDGEPVDDLGDSFVCLQDSSFI